MPCPRSPAADPTKPTGSYTNGRGTILDVHLNVPPLQTGTNFDMIELRYSESEKRKAPFGLVSGQPELVSPLSSFEREHLKGFCFYG